MNLIKRVTGEITQLLFPLRCPVCDEIVTPYGQKVCSMCQKRISYIGFPRCEKCGKKLYSQEQLCKDCKGREHFFVKGRSLYEYRSMVQSVYRFKYGGRREYASFYGEEIAFYLGEFIKLVHPDALVPIPLHRKRKKMRGYNQAALLAEAVGGLLGIPVYEDYLVRIKNTKPLKEQNPLERQNNLKKAFIIGRNDVKLKTIILIDDIYTTGSTIDEAALVCRAGGVSQIYFVTLAGGESM